MQQGRDDHPTTGSEADARDIDRVLALATDPQLPEGGVFH